MTTATKLLPPKAMIGKIKKGKNFAGLTKYILDKEEAELVCTNLAGDTSQDFYRQLEATCRLNPRVQSPVSHISISFAPGEKPNKEQPCIPAVCSQQTIGKPYYSRYLPFAAEP